MACPKQEQQQVACDDPVAKLLANVPTPSRAKGGKDGRSRNSGSAASSALDDIMRRRGVEEAWNALEDMQRRGVPTDKFTVSRMLMKTVGDGRARPNQARVYRGITLVERFIEQQPTDVDEVLFNALLDTCCRLKDLSRIESTVAKMRQINVQPSPVTLGILVKTYGQAGDLQKVLEVWDDMEKQRGQANAVTYGCMIDACVKCGNLPKAVEIFGELQAAGKHRNTILYTTLIKGHGLNKDLASALKLFREMPNEGVPYNTITYNSVMDACVKCDDLAAAESLLREMTAARSDFSPDLITFSTLLKGYCHVGDLDKALQVTEAIKARGLSCDELVYNTLMDGCVKANDITAGVGLFEEMIQQGMRPSTITHSILARLYQRAGYEDDAAEAVAQLYQNHGLERPSGSDRAKGFNRRGGGQRSPVGGRTGSNRASVNPSPTNSPASTTSLGLHGDIGFMAEGSPSNVAWGAIPMMPGYGESSAAQSMASTPLGSPVGSPTHGNQVCMSLSPVDFLCGPRGMHPMGGCASHGASFGLAPVPPVSSIGSTYFVNNIGASPCAGVPPYVCNASPVFGSCDQQSGSFGGQTTLHLSPACPMNASEGTPAVPCVPSGDASLRQVVTMAAPGAAAQYNANDVLYNNMPCAPLQAPLPQGVPLPTAIFQPHQPTFMDGAATCQQGQHHQ